jgi:hypothetical protein
MYVMYVYIHVHQAQFWNLLRSTCTGKMDPRLIFYIFTWVTRVLAFMPSYYFPLVEQSARLAPKRHLLCSTPVSS